MTTIEGIKVLDPDSTPEGIRLGVRERVHCADVIDQCQECIDAGETCEDAFKDGKRTITRPLSEDAVVLLEIKGVIGTFEINKPHLKNTVIKAIQRGHNVTHNGNPVVLMEGE
jgi:hypothetical protein